MRIATFEHRGERVEIFLDAEIEHEVRDALGWIRYDMLKRLAGFMFGMFLGAAITLASVRAHGDTLEETFDEVEPLGTMRSQILEEVRREIEDEDEDVEDLAMLCILVGIADAPVVLCRRSATAAIAEHLKPLERKP